VQLGIQEGENMNNNQVAPHEILELHELLNLNILGVKKLNASVSMVQDETLKNLMQNSINGKKMKIQELQNFINSQLGAQLNNQNNNQSGQ
jgi:similar to spore coat protein